MVASGRFALSFVFVLAMIAVSGGAQEASADDLKIDRSWSLDLDRRATGLGFSSTTLIRRITDEVEAYGGIGFQRTSERRSHRGAVVSDVGVGFRLDKNTTVTTGIGAAYDSDDTSDVFISTGYHHSF